MDRRLRKRVNIEAGVSLLSHGFCISRNKLITLPMYFKIFVSVVLLSLIQSTAIDCTFEAADGIHYDLSALINNNEDYRIYDYLQTSKNQRYLFVVFCLFL